MDSLFIHAFALSVKNRSGGAEFDFVTPQNAGTQSFITMEVHHQRINVLNEQDQRQRNLSDGQNGEQLELCPEMGT